MVTGPAPLVTVIVPTYNRAPVLRITLESLRRQTFTDWTALVVGDHCTDDSGDVVAWMGDPRIRWHNRETNGGQSAWPVNDALAMVETPWIAYLTHDDLWFPWHLEELLRTASETGADFVHALALDFAFVPAQDRMAMVHVFADPPTGSGVEYGYLPLPPCTWLHRRSLVDDLGPWSDPDRIDTAPDQEFQRRAALGGARFGFSPRLSVLYFPVVSSGRSYRHERAPASASYAGAMWVNPERLETDLLRKFAAGIAAGPDPGPLQLPDAILALLATPADRLDRDRLTAIAIAVGHGLARVNAPMWRQRYAGRNTPESVRAFQEFRRARQLARGLDGSPIQRLPLAIRSAALERAADGVHGRIVLAVDGLSSEPVALVDGIPAPARADAHGRLVADLPLAVPPRDRVEVQVLSGGSVSAPVSVTS